jgi:hypothetical protein
MKTDVRIPQMNPKPQDDLLPDVGLIDAVGITLIFGVVILAGLYARMVWGLVFS